MKEILSKKNIYTVLVVILAIMFIVITGIRTYTQWTDVRYAGEITNVSDDTFVIKIEHNAEITVRQSPDIRIRKGRTSFEGALQPGNFVIVAGTPNQDGTFEAHVIRVIHAPYSRP